MNPLVVVLFLTSQGFKPSDASSTSSCADKIGQWFIGTKKTNWCNWAKKAGNAHIHNRCRNKNLYDDCPVTCDNCPSTTPSPAASPSCSCEALTAEIEGITNKVDEILSLLKPSVTLSPVPSMVPSPVPSTPPLLHFVPEGVSSGWTNTCATDNAQKLWCWGSNNFGQLGTGDELDSSTPTEITLAENVEEISTGGQHTCMIDSLRKLWCWGRNGKGQLGIGDGLNRSIPTQINVDNDVAQISAGLYYSCMIDSLSKLFCWGANAYGKLGTGDNLQRDTPTEVDVTNGALQVSAYNHHTCIIDNLRKVFCWGWNRDGQLGVGDNSDLYVYTPTEVDFAGNAAQVRVGNYHTCLISDNEKLWCFGGNSYGQLGTGDNSNRNVPTAIVGANNAKEISSSSFAHTCMIDNLGKLYCWGFNQYGQLGTGDYVDRNTPAEINLMNDAVQISVGSGHTCIVDNNDKLFCWGQNSANELGNGGSSNTAIPALIAG